MVRAAMDSLLVGESDEAVWLPFLLNIGSNVDTTFCISYLQVS
jgi:hypothetical protein